MTLLERFGNGNGNGYAHGETLPKNELLFTNEAFWLSTSKK